MGGTLHAGALMGMIIVFLTGLARAAGAIGAGDRSSALHPRLCGRGAASAPVAALAGAGVGRRPDRMPAPTGRSGLNVVALGFCNGVFAVAAIGAMMRPGQRGATKPARGPAHGRFRRGADRSASRIGAASAGAASLDAVAARSRPALAGPVLRQRSSSLEGALFLLAAGLAFAHPVTRRNRPATPKTCDRPYAGEYTSGGENHEPNQRSGPV